MRVLPLAVLSLVALAFTPACANRPDIVEFWAQPEVSCAGDRVMLRVRVDKAQHGRSTIAPPPVGGGPATTLWDFSGGPEVYDHEYQICESTEFDLVAWNGDAEGACDAGNTRCAAALASVVEGDHLEQLDFDPCRTSRFGNRAEIAIARTDYSESFVVVSIENCGGQIVTLHRDGSVVPPAMARPGAAFAGFEGERWVGTWVATQTVGIGEECPVEGEVVVESAPRPDEICLRFTVRCPGSDACG